MSSNPKGCSFPQCYKPCNNCPAGGSITETGQSEEGLGNWLKETQRSMQSPVDRRSVDRGPAHRVTSDGNIGGAITKALVLITALVVIAFTATSARAEMTLGGIVALNKGDDIEFSSMADGYVSGWRDAWLVAVLEIFEPDLVSASNAWDKCYARGVWATGTILTSAGNQDSDLGEASWGAFFDNYVEDACPEWYSLLKHNVEGSES